MKNTDQSSRRNNRHAFFPRTAPLRVALCALLLAGCTTGGPQGAGDLAGRQSPASAAGEISPKTVLSIARRLRETGNLPAAITFYRRAIVLDPNNVAPYIGLGDALLADGLPNDAADSFRSALSMASTNADAMRGLGQTLVALDKPLAAKTILEKSINIHPSAAAYGALGVADDLMGKSAEATEAYKHGLTLAPDNLNLLNNYGLSQAISGDYDAAVATLHRAATDPRAGSRNRLNLAMALGLAGRMRDAAQVARIDLDERSVRNNLAYYTELRGLSPKARAAAILRPQAPLITHIAATHCDGAPCPKPAMPGATASAAPTTPVASKPLAANSAPKLAAKAPAEAEAKHEAAVKPAEPAKKLARDAAPAKHPDLKKADAAMKPAEPTKKLAREAAPAKHPDLKKADASTKPMPLMHESKAKAAAVEPAHVAEHDTKQMAAENHGATAKMAAATSASAKPADAKITDPTTTDAKTAKADQATLSVARDDAKPAVDHAAMPAKTASAADVEPAAGAPVEAKATETKPTTLQANAGAEHGAPMADASTTQAATPSLAPAPSLASMPAPKSDETKPTKTQLADAMPTVLSPTYPPSSAGITPTSHAQDAAPVTADDAKSDEPAELAKSDMPKSKTPATQAADESQPAKTADSAFVAATGEPTPSGADASSAARKNPIVKAAAVVPAATAPSRHHSWVQLGTYRYEHNAQAQLKETATSHKDLLEGLPLSIRQVDLGPVRGTYYLLRVGPVADMGQAHDLCSALESHSLDCMIVR